MINTSPEILNIAHRGARSLAPENTLAAARAGLDAGADMWELDVALTADGIPVLLHDDTLERTSNAANVYPNRHPWNVHQFTFDHIRQLDFGSWFVETDPFGQIAAGNVLQADSEGFKGETAPTLQAALEFTRQHNWRVNVEIKDLRNTPGDVTVAAQVVQLIEDLDMVEQVIISSFHHPYLAQIKKLNPALATGALTHLPITNPAGLLTHLKAQAYHPHKNAISPPDIALLRGQGFGVNPYTVNNESEMKTLIDAQASGIITDFPQQLAILLRTRKET